MVWLLTRWMLAFCLVLMCVPPAQAFPLVLWVDGDNEAKPKPLGTPAALGIEWDEAALSSLQAASTASAVQPEAFIVQLTNPTCLPCKQQWNAGQVQLSPLGWKFGPTGHFRQLLATNLPTPTYRLMRGGVILREWPSGASWVDMSNALRKAIDEPATGKAEQAMGFISLGTIPAKAEVGQFIDALKPILGNGGKLTAIYKRQGQLAPLTLPGGGGISVIIPQETELTWTMPGEAVVITASKPLVVQMTSPLPASVRLAGVTIGRDRITPGLIGLPDPHINIK